MTVKIHTNLDGVRVTTSNCWGPTQLAHYGDLQLSQSSKPQKYIGHPAREQLRASSDIFSYAMSGRPHQSWQPNFKVLSCRAIFTIWQIELSFIHKTHAWTGCFLIVMWKNLCVLWVTIKHFRTFHFQILH